MGWAKLQPLFKSLDGNTKKQVTGNYPTIDLPDIDKWLHQDLPGEITAWSCVASDIDECKIIDWVFIKNGPAGPITFYARFGIWDATMRMTLKPDAELLLPDVSCLHYTPHLDDEDGNVLLTWPCEPTVPPEGLEEFLETRSGTGTWYREEAV